MPDDPIPAFRTRLRELRRASRLTQEQLAERATLNYKHYQEIERGGKTEVRLSTLAKIATTLHIPIAQLFTDEPAPQVVAEAEARYRIKSPPDTHPSTPTFTSPSAATPPPEPKPPNRP